MKLQGQNNLTGNITSISDSFTFYGAKPSEIACLSNISSNLQTQLNNKLSSDSLNNYTPYYYVNSISSYIL